MHLIITNNSYIHHIVNHSKKIILDPDSSGIHTQNIRQLRRDIKEWVKGPGMRSEYFSQYFARYLFIHQFQDQLLHHFLVEAACLYPPQSECEPQHSVGVPVPAVPDFDLTDFIGFVPRHCCQRLM